MRELAITTYLRNGGTIESIQEQYKLFVSRHQEFPNLVLFKYNQLESPMTEKICQEARGIILDESNEWMPVCYAYSKFFNLGEPLAAEIDWDSANVLEKLDGSLCNLYYYHGKWHVATSGSPDASGNVGDESVTFKDLFWRTFHDLGYQLPAPSFAVHPYKMTFMFELLCPENKIVVDHEKPRLVLHGVRDLFTYKEYPPAKPFANDEWEVVQSFELHSVDDVVAAAKKLNPLKQEGFVVVDKCFNRLKIKSPTYVYLHRMKSFCTDKNFVDLVRTGEYLEYIAYFPEFQAMYDKYEQKFKEICKEVLDEFEQIRYIDNRKDFAEEAKKSRYSSILFSLYSGKVKTPQEFISNATGDYVYRLFGLK